MTLGALILWASAAGLTLCGLGIVVSEWRAHRRAVPYDTSYPLDHFDVTGPEPVDGVAKGWVR